MMADIYLAQWDYKKYIAKKRCPLYGCYLLSNQKRQVKMFTDYRHPKYTTT